MPVWYDLTKAIIGPLIAAVVFILGLLWRDRIERRNAAQAWFEQTYIYQGIDVFVSRLHTMRDLVERRPLSDIDVIPSDIYWRLFAVIPSNEYFLTLDIVQKIVFTTVKNQPITLTLEERKDLFDCLFQMVILTDSIRAFLLGVRVRNKRSVFRIRENPVLRLLLGSKEQCFLRRESLVTVNQRLQKMFDDGLTRTIKAVKELECESSE